jgi:hypothetical protein
MKEISISKFKATCLAAVEDARKSGAQGLAVLSNR